MRARSLVRNRLVKKTNLLSLGFFRRRPDKIFLKISVCVIVIHVLRVVRGLKYY